MSLESSNDRGVNITKVPIPPSIFDDATSMISVASSVYIFANLRKLARDERTSLSLKDFEPPMTVTEIVLAIEANKEALKDYMSPKKYDKLQSTSQRMAQLYTTDAVLEKSDEPQLVEFVGIESHKQLFHAIAINRPQRRITVSFRGSANKNDYITDTKIVQTKVENPAYVLDEKLPITINLHSGFHKYLFKKNKETGNPRIEEILASVKNLLCQNPGYQLYCTGHSLGGALSSLFAFYAAADEEITQLTMGPVRVVSIASPYVGNTKFLLAFQALEREKRLQHLRLANKEDIVTKMPRVAPNIVNGAVNLYRHCGIKLLLNPPTEENSKSFYELSYPKDRTPDEKPRKLLKKIAFHKDTENIKYYHRCSEYLSRVEACKEYLEDVTLDDLYNDTSIVGNILGPGHQPEVMHTVTAKASRVARSGVHTSSKLKKRLKTKLKSKLGFSTDRRRLSNEAVNVSSKD